MSRKLLFVAVAATILGLSPSLAQDYTLSPTYGTVSLSSGFEPDPYSVGVVAGGSIDASTLGGSCYGYIANAPDYRLTFTAGSLPLYISALSSGDTTLVINGPDGAWYCDDDSAGNLNPMVEFANPTSGQYDIWIGSFSQGENPDATLYISELGAGTTAGPDFTLNPTYGQATLTSGFTPDPYTVSVVAGGAVNVGTAGLGDSCVGFVAEAPDFRLNYTAGSYPTLYISALSDDDTTLVINAPDGTWYCDDDGAGYPNPMIAFDNPMSGQYDIWVGAYGGGNPNATLNISEIGNNTAASDVSGSGSYGSGPDYTLTPTYGQIDLATGFTPRPYTVALTAGGTVDANGALGTDTNGNACYGSIAQAPDFRLNFTAGNAALILSVLSDTDTTLIVNGPDGNWYCDDDTGGNYNPELQFAFPLSGQYDIWVGTYDGGAYPAATLQISEQGGGK